MRRFLAVIITVAAIAAVAAFALDAGVFDVPLEELEARYATDDSRFAMVDGVRLHYMDQGSGDPVLLLHASFMNLRTWDSLANALAPTHRVVRPDLLIAGLTGPEPDKDYSFERNLDLVVALLDQLGIEEFSIVSTSSGGTVGFRMAARYPQRVKRLVLINSAGMPRTAATNPNRARGRGGLTAWIQARYQSRDRVRELLKLNFIEPNEPPPWLVDMNYDMWRRAGRREAGMIQMKNFRTGDPQTTLGKIVAPTLVLWGLENRTVMHLEADVFQHWLVQAPTMLKKYPGVGHYLYMEIPEEFERDVAAFLAGEKDGELRLQNLTPYTG